MSLRTTPQSKFDPGLLTILVVDDQTFMRRIIVDIVHASGVSNVIAARNGQDGLELLADRHPDIVIADWDMTSMSGTKFVRGIRHGSGQIRQTPIIVLSNQTQRQNIDQARAEGVDEFIAKPITANKIIFRMREICRRARPFVETMNYTGPCRRRKNGPYFGQLRRMTDPISTIPYGIDHLAEQKRLILSCIEFATEMAEEAEPGDRLHMRSIFNAVSEACSVAKEADDTYLLRATRSLLRYVQLVGANNAIQPGIVATHLDAIQKLAALPDGLLSDKESLANGLEQIVEKKLRIAHA